MRFVVRPVTPVLVVSMFRILNVVVVFDAPVFNVGVMDNPVNVRVFVSSLVMVVWNVAEPTVLSSSVSRVMPVI